MPLRSFQQLEPNAATPPKPERCFSGACLDATSIIAVSAVGAGFLVIPTITSPLGVWPTAVGLTLAWLFLALAGVAYVEAASRIIQHDLDGGGEHGASIFTVGRYCFGTPAAVMCSIVFMVQMLATVTANVAKTAELLHGTTPLSYASSVLLPPAAIGALVFGAPRAFTQRVNTVLTLGMVCGFLALFAATLREPKTTAGLTHARWDALLPRRGWVMPVFLNTVRFGEGVPVIVQSLGPERRRVARTAVLCGSAAAAG